MRWEGAEALSPGEHTLEYDFKYDGLGFATLAFNNMGGIGRSGTGTFKVDGKVISTQKMERTIPIVLSSDETFDIGADTGTFHYIMGACNEKTGLDCGRDRRDAGRLRRLAARRKRRGANPEPGGPMRGLPIREPGKP